MTKSEERYVRKIENESDCWRKACKAVIEGKKTEPSGRIAVTSVTVFPAKGEGTLKATAEVTLNGAFMIHSMRVMDGLDGLYVGYPLEKEPRPDGNRVVCFPINKDLRIEIENRVLEEYQRVTESGNARMHAAIV